jgi:phage protein D
MAAFTTMAEESRAQRSFYTPQFRISIDRVGLQSDVLRDVVSLTYKDNVNEIDSFELTVNNWDARHRDFKYAGAETPRLLDPNNPASRADTLFEPCNKVVEVRMGYTGELTRMMVGNFTTMEPTFPSGGAPTLAVRGLNVLHELRRKQYTTAWEKITDSRAAKEIESLKDKESGRNRFPIPIEIDPNAAKDEPVLEYLSQQNQYDVDFLFQRARQRGYVIYIKEDEPRRLYFGPSTANQQGMRDVSFELRYPGSLLEFKPTLTTARQVKSVTVHGWNRQSKQPITETVTLDDAKLNKNQDLYEMLKKCDPREEIVVNEPVFTQKQARERAIALLQQRQKEMVKCTATTVGLPELRAGRLVRIKGVGPTFGGTYFITETTHTIGAGGYTTMFSARREDEGAAAS